MENSVDNHLAGEFNGGAAINSHRNSSSMDAERSCLDHKKVNRVEETEPQDHLVETHNETKRGEMTESSTNSKASPESEDNPKTPSIDEETATDKPQKDEGDQSDTTNSDQKTLKKPDKILPCPRCNSMDTKFCYYNNYNVNQPRHFCKSCQRYWTSGGTMRNVPVGAGRRKNKNSASHCRYITISEALQAAQFDTPDALHNPINKANGNVLTFGSDSSVFESMASALKWADQKASNGTRIVTCRRGENGDDCSSGSSVTTSNSMAEPKMQNIHGFSSQVPSIPPGVAWPYPWNSAVPLPALCPPGFTMPFYPSPYWNCGVPGAWSIPWLPPLSNQKAQGLESNSPHLGKHSREEEPQEPSQPEEKQKKQNSVLIPKTLRIDDPDEAAKSSIWATLGIKNDSNNRGELFKAFQAKGEEKNHRVANSPALQANPAALSRSLCFQERA